MANKKEKNNTLLYIVIVLLLLVVLGFVCLMFTGTLSFNGENKVDEEVVEEEKVVLTDFMKKDITHKIKILLTPASYGYATNSNYFELGYLFQYSVLKRELTDYERQYITLYSTEYYDINMGKWESVPVVKNAIDTAAKAAGPGHEYSIRQGFKTLPYQMVNKHYMDLFGKELVNPVEYVRGCPMVYYSSDTKEFYRFNPACGGMTTTKVMTLVDKFEVTKDGVDVYAYFGYSALNDAVDKSTVYSDFDITENADSLSPNVTFKNVIEEVPLNGSMTGSGYKLDDTNKEKFSKYKFVFKSNDGSYYFDKVEQVK